MQRLRLTLATGDYDHVRDLVHGVVRPEGIEATCLVLPVEEMFFRFVKFREWDVSELSFGKYAALRSQGDASLVAIPVFPSRVFRLSSIYVRGGGRAPARPMELRGKRIGVPEWAQTAAVYSRGWLVHEIGIPLDAIEWLQAGVNQPGRTEKVGLRLPEGVRLARVADRSLNELLLTGELDAVLSARPPTAFADGSGRVVRLLPDFRELEEAYYRRSGIFPIMHVIALRAELHARHPWVAMSLLKAFEQAKRRSLARLDDIAASHAPLAWIGTEAARLRELFGPDPWPYGLEPNRRTLDAFLQYAHEQGVCARRLAPEELFAAETLASFRV